MPIAATTSQMFPPTGCARAKKPLRHNCSTLRFGLQANLAKEQVLGILFFDKAGKITKFAQQQLGFAHLINSETSEPG